MSAAGGEAEPVRGSSRVSWIRGRFCYRSLVESERHLAGWNPLWSSCEVSYAPGRDCLLSLGMMEMRNLNMDKMTLFQDQRVL
jgi:hypothetical protein